MDKQRELEQFRQKVLPEYQEILKQEKVNNPYFGEHGYRIKRCRICGKLKRLSAFYKNPLKKLGRFDECKKCIKERRQQNVDRKRKAGVKASMSA